MSGQLTQDSEWNRAFLLHLKHGDKPETLKKKKKVLKTEGKNEPVLLWIKIEPFLLHLQF